MSKKIKISKSDVLSIIIWLILLFLVAIFNGKLPIKSSYIVMSFLLFNTCICILPKQIKYSLPMIIYRITGLVRYIIIPIAMAQQNIAISYSVEMKLLMTLELLGIFIGSIIFSKKKNIESVTDSKSYINNLDTRISLGLPSLIIMLIGIILIMYNRSYIERYIILGAAKSSTIDIYGGITVLLACFFLLFYIGCLKFIKNKFKISDFFKVVLSVLISIIYINGSSITGSNVSRWSMLISGIISYIYMTRLYPKYTKKLMILLSSVILFSITFASTMKFTWNDNYSTLNGTIEEEFKFKTLNAYFSGPHNMQVALDLKNELDNSSISKIEIYISDTFGNFPVLNRFLSNPSHQSTTLFNYKYYNSSIATDQIIPYSCQLYNVFGIFFIIFEIVQVYFSYYLYFACKKNNNFLNIFCCIYLSFFLSLINCVNYSILMQSIWIHVLPIFIIYKINNKTIIK